MVRFLGLIGALCLAACGESDGVTAEQLFEDSLRSCRVDDFSARVEGLGSVYYTIIGRDGNDCNVEMVFISSPNPQWVDKPLRVRLGEDRSGDALKGAITACLEGQEPQVSDGSCDGALMDVLGLSGGGAPSVATAAFAEAGCGKAYTGQDPALYRMYDPSSDLWGYVDGEGRWKITPQYAQAMAFSEGLAAVINGQMWQVIDTSGAVAIPDLGDVRAQARSSTYGKTLYQSPMKPFSEGCAVYSNQQGRYFLSRDGQLWLDKPTDPMQAAADKVGGIVRDIDSFRGGFAEFHIDVEEFRALDPQGYIDSAGEVAVEPIYARLGPFDPGTGYARVGLSKSPENSFVDRWIYIDSSGAQVLPKEGEPRYRNAERFSEGVAAVRLGRQYQYIDTDGTFLNRDLYDTATPFHDGMAYVRGYNEYGWINRDGDWAFVAEDIGLCDTQWPQQVPFDNGLALVIVRKDGAEDCGAGGAMSMGGGANGYENGEFAYVNKAGEIVMRESTISAP
ncbi:MAG: WG repeat-containing protein [Pseudomonadota bacterium]